VKCTTIGINSQPFVVDDLSVRVHDSGMEGDKRVAEKSRHAGFVVTDIHGYRLLRI